MMSEIVGRMGRVFVTRLDESEDLLLAIRNVMKRSEMKAGVVLSITGALTHAVLQRFATGQKAIAVLDLEGPMKASGHGIVGWVSAPERGKEPFGVGRYVDGEPYAHIHLEGRTLMIVADEDAQKLEPSPPAFVWIFDVSCETRPVPFATFQLDCFDGSSQPKYTGCHQPCEKITGTEIPVAWFAQGLRVMDISKPHSPREAAFYLPDVPPGSDRVQSNDVTVDDRGLIYLYDRVRGLHILERV